MARILHMIPGLTGGGAERQLTLLAAMQVRRGHEVHIALLRPEHSEALAGAGVHIHTLQPAGHYDPRLVLELRTLIRRIHPDIAQTWLVLFDVLGGSAALLTKTPWVLSERSQVEAYPPSWKHRLRASLARKADAVVANSAGGVRYWLAQDIAPRRAFEIPNAVDIDAIEAATDAELPAHFVGRPLILFVGRLAAEKNPLVMIDALVAAMRDTDAVALLCGTGPFEAEMRERIDANQLHDRIVLAGARADVFGLLKRAQLCLAVSVFEGSPNVALESMAAGCPLVVSDIAGYRQLLDERSALFVPVNSVTEIARAIRDVLLNSADAAKRAARAREGVMSFTPGHVATLLDAVYGRIGDADA